MVWNQHTQLFELRLGLEIGTTVTHRGILIFRTCFFIFASVGSPCYFWSPWVFPTQYYNTKLNIFLWFELNCPTPERLQEIKGFFICLEASLWIFRQRKRRQFLILLSFAASYFIQFQVQVQIHWLAKGRWSSGFYQTRYSILLNWHILHIPPGDIHLPFLSKRANRLFFKTWLVSPPFKNTFYDPFTFRS